MCIIAYVRFYALSPHCLPRARFYANIGFAVKN